MTEYYHVARVIGSLIPGQVLKPEHWAKEHNEDTDVLASLMPRRISHHGRNYIGSIKVEPPDSSVTLEMLAEFIRQSHFKHRPSRFSSLFAWKTLDDAKRFALTYPPPATENGAIPECEFWLVQSLKPVFEADMAWLRFIENWSRTLVALYRYWSGTLSQQPVIEVLLPLPVRVVRQIT